MKNSRHPSSGALVMAAFAAAMVLHVTAPASAQQVRELEAHEEYVYMIAFSRDGKLMATASGDNTAILWDAERFERQLVLEHEAAVYAAALSPDGQSLVTGSGDGVVTLWNSRDGTKIAAAQRHQDAVYCVAFSPDGQQIASAGGSTDGGDTVCRIWNARDLAIAAEYAGHARQVYGVTYSPDGRTLATSSSDKTIRLWNMASGRSTILRGHTSDVYRCDFSPDGKQLASTSQDGTLRLWSLDTQEPPMVFEQRSQNPLYAAKFSRDGRRLAAVGDDRRLRIWQMPELRLLFEQRISPSALYAVAFTPLEDQVVVAGEDGKLYLIATSSPP